jgi:predicted aminopeptidase
VKALALAACAALLSGCYFAQLGAGQLALLEGQRPLDDAIAEERDPERRVLLQHVPDLRRYANERLQLRPGHNYTGYCAGDPDAVAHVVAGSERTRFEPYTWWFPIAGKVPYKSHFSRARAEAEAAELEAQGYDAHVGPVTAYSTLGILRDPLTTPMLRDGLIRFVEVLFHEMAHARLYVAGQTDFNEQLASFVGKQAALEYLRSRYADAAGLMAEAEAYFVRREQLDARVLAAIDVLDALYERGLPEPEVLRRRQPVFDGLEAELAALYPDRPRTEWRMNNARLLQWRRYSRGTELFERLFAQGGGSWRRFWFLVERYASEQF